MGNLKSTSQEEIFEGKKMRVIYPSTSSGATRQPKRAAGLLLGEDIQDNPRVVVVDDHLDCTVCLEVKDGVIYQCDEEHLICKGCYDDIVNKQLELLCPTCRQRYPSDPPKRSRIVQEMISSIITPCPNKSSGCSVVRRRKR